MISGVLFQVRTGFSGGGTGRGDPVWRSLFARLWRRWSAGECSGRSRGGFSTKIDLSAEADAAPLPMLLTPGQFGDSQQFKAVLEKIRVPGVWPGQLHTRPDSLGAGKA